MHPFGKDMNPMQKWDVGDQEGDQGQDSVPKLEKVERVEEGIKEDLAGSKSVPYWRGERRKSVVDGRNSRQKI